MEQAGDGDLPRRLESTAIDLARAAGVVLREHFSKAIDVEYKDEAERDPVSTVDKASQELLSAEIARRWPGHGILGEEILDGGQGDDDAPAPDVVWVLDPLDGTKNYLAGLPVYAASVGVLHRGAPVAGAIYAPWPGKEDGVVFHASRGGGAYVEDDPISVFQAEEPSAKRLATLPAYFTSTHRFLKPMRGRLGEIRNTGSIAYDMALVASGVLQYTYSHGPRLWDAAGGATIVMEAGGAMMRGRQARGALPFTTTTRWQRLESFLPRWESGKTTMGELRRWSAPLVTGSPGVIRYVTANVRRRSGIPRRLAGAGRRALARRRRRRGDSDKREDA